MKGYNIMANPTSAQLRNARDFQDVVETYPTVNNADWESVQHAPYEDPLTVANGCANSLLVTRAIEADLVSNDLTFGATRTATRARATSAFIRRLTETAEALIDSNGTLAAYRVSSNAVQNQRNRTKRFAINYITQLNRDLAENYDSNVNFLSDEALDNNYAACILDTSAMVYDGCRDRIYVLFTHNPDPMMRHWLRCVGFTNSGTNQLWYRNNTEIDTKAMFTQYATDFVTTTRNIYTARASEFRTALRGTTSDATACTMF